MTHAKTLVSYATWQDGEKHDLWNQCVVLGLKSQVSLASPWRDPYYSLFRVKVTYLLVEVKRLLIGGIYEFFKKLTSNFVY